MWMEVYIKSNSLIARLAAKVLKTSNCAIVFRRTIYLYNISKVEILNNKNLLCHELTHILQWKRKGILRFSILYLWYSMKYGYYQNPFEVEARNRENDFSMMDGFIIK